MSRSRGAGRWGSAAVAVGTRLDPANRRRVLTGIARGPRSPRPACYRFTCWRGSVVGAHAHPVGLDGAGAGDGAAEPDAVLAGDDLAQRDHAAAAAAAFLAE